MAKKKKKMGWGGPRPNSGRKPDWFRWTCKELVFKHKIPELWAAVAMGVDFEQVVNKEGETIKVPASVRDRLHASNYLVEYGEGKPAQTMDVNVDESGSELAARPARDLLLLAGLLARECSKGA